MPGLDPSLVQEIDWQASLSNVRLDTRSDFVLSPHFDAIYVNSGERLIEQTRQALRSGNYHPRLPVTFGVPKGGGLMRPGSILEPKDRLVHQALVEACLPNIEAELDRTRVFSQVPSSNGHSLFEETHLGWYRYQERIANICRDFQFVLKADVANYFETIPQHVVVNLLTASGVRPEYVSLLEEQLLAFRQRSSNGILQGIFPSDILGNFYLSEFDAHCELHGLQSARYVDDLFVGFESELGAQIELVRLGERLRQNGLSLNSQKTLIAEATHVIAEEKELDRLFDAARREIEDTVTFLRESGYGFQGNWLNEEEEEPDDIDLELEAVRYLLLAPNTSENQREKIDRFCLPILRGANDDVAVEMVLNSLAVRPKLTRIYASYLTHFAPRSPDMVKRLCELISADQFFCDYQRMYLLASILNCAEVGRAAVLKALQWLESPQIGPETRAICAIFCAKFGSANQKRTVRVRYENEPSEYVRSAILFSAQYFPVAEKRSAKRAWGSQSEINALISEAI